MARIIGLLGALSSAFGLALAAGQGTVTFTNKIQFLFDVNGNQIDAIGAHINWFNNKYYLYGTGTTGVNSYSSVDMVNWVPEGVLGLGSSRPHIIYNNATKQYVVWSDGAGSAGYVVGTSTSPATGFKSSGIGATDPAYGSLQKADMAVEVINGKGYLVHSALDFQSPRAGSIWPQIWQNLYVLQLTPDLLNTTQVSYPVISAANDTVDGQGESPDIFYRAPYFYVAASNTCGFCRGSIALLYRSKSIQGPWTRQILAPWGCNGQVEGILPLVDPVTNTTTYVWQTNIMQGGARIQVNGHGFIPLTFNDDGSAQPLNCDPNASWDVKLTIGDGAAPAGKIQKAADMSPQLADYFTVCDSDSYNLFQTWTNSKTGTLKEIGINILSSPGNYGGISIKVFKFSNLTDLVQPGYKWTLLGSTSFNKTATSQSVYNVVSVNLTATVTKGDMLGFSYGNSYLFDQFISGGDPTPFCHMEYHTNSTIMALLEQGSGQNSPRGMDGKTSPLVSRSGRGIKFYSIVE